MSLDRRRLAGIVLSMAIIAFCFSPLFQDWVYFPHEVRILAGSPHQIKLPLPFGLSVAVDSEGLWVDENALAPGAHANARGKMALLSQEPGEMNLELKLFGLLPLRRLNVQVVEPIEVVPSGHSIGVTLRTATMVVGHASVRTANGVGQPSREAGLRTGDLIVEINGQRMPSVKDVADQVEDSGRNGKTLNVVIKRQGELKQVQVAPLLCQDSNRYRIGAYVRDDAAGVGTLTFVDRESGVFGALGHVIADIDTSQVLEVVDGRIMRSKVTAIDQGRSGQPGEKRTLIVDEHKILGRFTANTNIGIFGEMFEDITEGSNPLPLALVDQVKEGPAEILTVINDERIERFSIEIVKVTRQSAPATKGMVIRVTDPRLLQETGGIVQGMSGSPIIQNNKLVGAVTHVFVNDPARGYGVFAEWMVRESGLLEKRQEASPTFFYRRHVLRNAGL